MFTTPALPQQSQELQVPHENEAARNDGAIHATRVSGVRGQSESRIRLPQVATPEWPTGRVLCTGPNAFKHLL